MSRSFLLTGLLLLGAISALAQAPAPQPIPLTIQEGSSEAPPGATSGAQDVESGEDADEVEEVDDPVVRDSSVPAAPSTTTPAAPVTPPQPDPAEVFVNANAAYENNEPAQAIELYRSLVERGHGSAELYYNLGNAYLRNGELGRSIASYRRSLALAPRNEDTRANLAFARKSTTDAIAPPAPPAILATLFFWHYNLGRGELALVVIIFNLLFWGLLAVRMFRRGNEVLRWATMIALILLLATTVSLGLRHLMPQRIAVVVPQEIEAYTAPDATSVPRFRLHAGTEVRIEDNRDGWLRVRLPTGQQGWIEGGWAEVVEL